MASSNKQKTNSSKIIANNSMRLSGNKGSRINRAQIIHFEFEGTTVQGYAGDTVASALLANDCKLLSRSFKYHRPRSVLTMAGQDANTLVQLNNEPNVLADRCTIENGLNVSGQNYNGSLEHDRDAILARFSKFMPVGFYYRAFFKPLGIWDKWESLIRKKAGLGKVNINVQPTHHDKQYLFYDILVVGAGPAGLSAASKASDAGLSVMLVDEQPELGGALNYHRFDSKGEKSEQIKLQLLNQIDAKANIDVFLDATCNGWFSDNYLPVIQRNRMFKVRAKQVIVATGAYEQHVVFRNNDIPGVMLCSAANRLVNLYGVKPGQRAVILTGNDDGYLNALELDDHGIDVAAIVDMREQPQNEELYFALSDKQIPVLFSSTVYEVIASKNNKGVCGVDIRKITSKGQVGIDSIKIDCDLVCMTAGYMPAYQLLCQAGAKLSYDESAQFNLTNLPDSMFIAGSVNGKNSLDIVIADGERAAEQAINYIKEASLTVSEDVYCDSKVNFYWPIFSHPDGKDFVDFDEDLQVQDIINATRLGYRDIQLVKRFTTVGMGPSQGRHSALPTARIVAEATNRTVTETGVTTARPPFMAEKLAHIAGRSFDPYRQTPMHFRHLELGAKMMPAGNWQRPAFYGSAEQRDACMQAESIHVRTKVGVIDLSTLGGIEIIGEDAAEFMNRMYTFAFLKQDVGKTRYAVLTNEQGVVIDDGVACRISEQHFYVTATTSGVERVYRDMLKWNAQWRLNIDVINVTSARAAVNLAGPDSRKVLQKLTELDLSPQAFPYLAYREAKVAGIPCRLLRVGFVGELGYELHVPTRYGEALWDIILEAGQEFDIKPFGVETQRLLRLEKGHIIVSQDTDAMTHPGEVNLNWAISDKKPFFVGQRSVNIVMAQTQKRKLVGFSLARHMAKPEEGHLVLSSSANNADVTGNVTSCEFSPTIGAYIGMGYVSVEQAIIGKTLPIRVEHGEIVDAEVVALPFYDPDTKRQEM